MRLLRDFQPDMEVQFVMFLLLVARRPGRPMTIGELVQSSGMAYASVSRNVHKWSDLGVFEIEEGTDDRRERFVRMTRKGEALIQRIEELL